MSIEADLIEYAATADRSVLWFELAIAFLIIYFAIIWFLEINKSTAVAIAFVPVLLLDWLISFGEYVFAFPFGYTYVTKYFVMTFNLIDYIFNFGFFKEFGLAAFNSVSGGITLSGWDTIFIYGFVFADSIIEFILIAYFLYYIFGKMEYALYGALIPVLLYSVYVSNPLTEYAQAEGVIKHILYFVDKATDIQLLTVIGTAFISFLLIVFLLSTLTNLFVSVGKSTIRPGLESSMWTVSLTGISFGLAVVYSMAVLLHPDYSWYVVLPLLVIYSIIRSGVKGFAQNRRDQREQQDMIRAAFRGGGGK